MSDYEYVARPFSLLIKPAGADCNLRCKYCFYLEKADIYGGLRHIHRMTTPVLERLIAQYMATEQPVYTFGWQGGEPTMMGPAFFRKAFELQRQYGKPGVRVSNGLQTNGTRITDEFAALFAEYNVLLGVSIDGPPGLHDYYRPYESGRGSHEAVMRGVENLRRHGVEHNVLTLVNAHNVQHPKMLYRYLKDNGFDYHQYIPCVEYAPDGTLQPWSIDAESWGNFLCELYDAWAGDPEPASIRRFDALMQTAAGGPPAMCSLASNCRQYFVVEHNGDVYPCDFYVTPDLKLGNVTTHRFGEMWMSPKFRAFGSLKRQLPQVCRDCEFLPYCKGDCPKNRFRGSENPLQYGAEDAQTARRIAAGGSAGAVPDSTAPGAAQTDPAAATGEPPVSELCGAWKQFFGHALEDIEQRARRYVLEH